MSDRGHSGLWLTATLCAIALCAPAIPEVPSAAVDQAPLPATNGAPHAGKHVAHNQKEGLYFQLRYGIGQPRVHAVAGGASLELRCLVLDAGKANALKEGGAAPVMIDRKTGKKLSMAAADGKPLQSAALEAGQDYWVTFGNRDKTVKPGNMVDIVIGTVHMSGLIVE